MKSNRCVVLRGCANSLFLFINKMQSERAEEKCKSNQYSMFPSKQQLAHRNSVERLFQTSWGISHGSSVDVGRLRSFRLFMWSQTHWTMSTSGPQWGGLHHLTSRTPCFSLRCSSQWHLLAVCLGSLSCCRVDLEFFILFILFYFS